MRKDEIENKVRRILDELKKDKIKALKKFSSEFDDYEGELKVQEYEFEEAEKILTSEDKEMIKRIMHRIEKHHRRQFLESSVYISNGSIYGILVRPIERIGIYVPGGKPLPSTLMMIGIPAKLAGVEEIVVTSPPKNGKIDPYIIYIAKFLGIREVYKIGGAHAIGAMAFGIGMRKVDKIFGPGNVYVTEAKRQVFGIVGIDCIAGPSEVCIIADENANKSYVMLDLLSQVEHGKDSIAWLLTNSKELIDYLNKNISSYREFEKIKFEFFETMDECMKRANEIAPEHLELMVANPLKWIDKIKNAGAIYVGDYTPVSAGDYFIGVNHVLPTGGSARFSSVLGVWDFVKRISFAYVGKNEFMEGRQLGLRMATIENMKYHGKSLEVRK